MKKIMTIMTVALAAIAMSINASAQNDTKKTKEGTAVGDRCMEIVQDDPDGNPLRLSDVVSQNKYTLIDFWASWCGPCLGEIPYMLASYERYGDKGFEIFGVSLDFRKEAWGQAIEQYGLDWIHVSDLEYWKNEAAVRYGVRSIPANFLVDENGVIVATNLRGEALIAKLAELLD